MDARNGNRMHPAGPANRWPPRMGALVLGAFLLTLNFGCELDEAALPPNIPPHTSLSIVGDTLNTTGYQTILHWWGTDLDGRIIGYAYRWDGPWTPAPEDSLWWEDPSWTFTTVTTDTFDVPIVGTYADRTFTIFAIDDHRAPDPQPVSQLFPLTNEIPAVSWSDTTRHPTLARPSLPAISFAWTPEDFDGRETIAFARLWLDVREGEDSAASAIQVVGDTVGAFFPEHFQGRSGERTVYCQVWDRAATPSPVISWTWNVTEPSGEFLLIDNAGESTPGPQRRDDEFWRERLDALTPENYHVIDVWEEGPFRSAQEVLPIFALFRGVLWYGGKHFDGSAPSDLDMLTGLRLAEQAIDSYIEEGGKLFLTGHNLIGTAAGLSHTFAHERLGIETIYTRYVDEAWISDTDLPRRGMDGEPVYVRGGLSLGGVDSLRVGSPITMTDFFAPAAALEPLLWLDPATLDTTEIREHATEPLHMAGLASWGGGRMVFASTVLTRFASGGQGTPEEAMETLLRDLFELP